MNTYQAVIVTDGVYSSTLFTYTCGDLEWSTTGNKPAVVGYNAGGTYFENHRSSGFDTVGNDVSCVVELRRSKRQVGGMMPTTVGMDVDVDELLMQATEACRLDFETDEANIPDPNTAFANPVQPCPCTLDQVTNDPQFITDTRFRPDQANCYIQESPVSGESLVGVISYGQQCCYDNSG